MNNTNKILLVLVICAAIVAACVYGAINGIKPAEKDNKTENPGGTEAAPGNINLSGSESVLINAAGRYVLSGKLSSSVEIDSEGDVVLVLNGVEITNPNGPAINAAKGCNLTIEIASGSTNKIVSGKESTIISADKNASLEDATGAAIYSKSNTTIIGDGKLSVGGYINNGIACTKDLVVKSGNVEIKAANNGLKGNDSLTIEGGNFEILSGNDGIKSEATLNVTGGYSNITAYGEGAEAVHIVLDGGELRISAQDDGVNASSDTDEKPTIEINGGKLVVSAVGDGIDSNGDITINGGTVVVFGPTSGRDAAFDPASESGGKLVINGGTVLGLCAQGMVEAFSQDSEQCSFVLNVQGSAGSRIVIKDALGNAIFSETSEKQFSALIFSSPDLVIGSSYTVEVDGNSYQLSQDQISIGSGGGMGGFGHGGNWGPGNFGQGGENGFGGKPFDQGNFGQDGESSFGRPDGSKPGRGDFNFRDQPVFQ